MRSATQPYIKNDLADPPVEPSLKGRKLCWLDLALQFKQNVKQPGAIAVKLSPLHDHHVKHVPASLVHDIIKARKICRVFFRNDLACAIQLAGIMSVCVVRVKRFNIIVTFFRHKHLVFAQQRDELGRRENPSHWIFPPDSEMAAVMYKTNVIDIEIFPGPVQASQLAEAGVAGRYIVSGIIFLVSEIQWGAIRSCFPLCTYMEWKVHRIIGHLIFFMRSHNYFDIFHFKSILI